MNGESARNPETLAQPPLSPTGIAPTVMLQRISMASSYCEETTYSPTTYCKKVAAVFLTILDGQTREHSPERSLLMSITKTSPISLPTHNRSCVWSYVACKGHSCWPSVAPSGQREFACCERSWLLCRGGT